MKVLIVDEDEDDVLLLKVTLREIDSSVNVIYTTNGRQCLRKIEETKPDLIFLDINMPMMSGKDCLDKIKKHEYYKAIPVIMYSTIISPSKIEEYRNVQFLKKPSSMIEFKQNIQAILSEYSGAEPSNINMV